MSLKFNTEGLARGASRHPWRTIAAWVVLMLAALVLAGTLLGDALTTDEKITNNPESAQAEELIQRRLSIPDNTISEMVVIRSQTATVDDPEFRAYVERVFGDLTGLGGDLVAGGVHYYMTGDESLVSADRSTTIVPLVLPEEARGEIGQVHRVIDEANQGASFTTLITGEATLGNDFMELSERDLQTGEGIGISVALVVLALVFGAVAAAVLPIALAIAAVIVALGATALVGQAFDLSFFVTNMITMMGLAVGIDYSLFIVSRYREERQHGLETTEAIAAAGATAGRAVLFSGMTVVLALCGLLIFPVSVFQSLGIGAILVVIAAVLASMTLLPAVLSLMGDRVNAIRLPLVQRRRTGESETRGGFWYRMAGVVMRQPVVSLIMAAGLLLAVASPYLDLSKGMAGISSLPDDLQSKQAFMMLQEEFGFGQDAPVQVIIDGKTESPSVQTAVQRLKLTMASDPAFVASEVQTHTSADLSVLSAKLAGDSYERGAMDAVVRLRSEYIPQAFAGVPAKVLVGGGTAGIVDFNETTDTYTPIVFAFVLGLSLVLLTVAFRSVVVPVKAIIMNLLSVGAAYGLLVLVFQRGVGADLLGFRQVDTIETWLPVFLFAVLFGLSMDYHVFLLSRIRERFNQTGDNTEAVAFGLRSTGRLITGAALIMVAVFGGFALGEMVMFQQMGFGLAAAVFMDATVVRSILVPATMRLLGKWNWYFPTWLQRIPDISIGESGSAEAVPAVEVKPRRVGVALGMPAVVPVEAECTSAGVQQPSQIDRPL